MMKLTEPLHRPQIPSNRIMCECVGKVSNFIDSNISTMKTSFYVLSTFILASFFVGCSSPEQQDQTSETEELTKGESCLYEVITDSTSMTWTAYKTTDKVGVSGTFDQIELKGLEKADDVFGVFANSGFSISVGSVNSANPDRDKKITEHFFGTMLETAELTGRVASLTSDKAEVVMVMNGISMKQEMDLETDGETYVKMSADLDLNNWNLAQSLGALNEICFDLHKGADGESKLWDEARVELKVMLKKDCP